LVERLREEAAEIKCEHDADADLLLEAAARVAKLEAALGKIAAGSLIACPYATTIARAALRKP
jgi:hypothetical protein